MTARAKGKVIGYFPSMVKQREKTRLMKLLGKYRKVLHAMIILHIILKAANFVFPLQNQQMQPEQKMILTV